MTPLYSTVHPVYISLLNEMLDWPKSDSTIVFADQTGRYTAQDLIASFTLGDALGLAYATALMRLVLDGILRQGGTKLEDFMCSTQYAALGNNPLQATITEGVKPLLKAAYAFLPNDRIAWRFMSQTYTVEEFLCLMENDHDKEAQTILTDCLRIFRDKLRRQAVLPTFKD